MEVMRYASNTSSACTVLIHTNFGSLFRAHPEGKVWTGRRPHHANLWEAPAGSSPPLPVVGSLRTGRFVFS